MRLSLSCASLSLIAVALQGCDSHNASVRQEGTSVSAAHAPAKTAADYAREDTVRLAARWQQTVGQDDMDESASAIIGLSSENEVSTVLSTITKPAVLGIRCVKGETDVIVQIQNQVLEHDGDSEGQSVRVRFDGGEPRADYWRTSSDHALLFAPNGIQLARRLTKTDTFRIEFTPSQMRPQTARFAVGGLQQKLGIVANACHWKI